MVLVLCETDTSKNVFKVPVQAKGKGTWFLPKNPRVPQCDSSRREPDGTAVQC